MGRRRPPDDEQPDPVEVDEHWARQFAEIGLIGLSRLLRSAALDARLDEYLRTNPRPEDEPDPDDPALDHSKGAA